MRKLVTTLVTALVLVGVGAPVEAAPYDHDAGVLNSANVPTVHSPIKPLVNIHEQPATWTAPQDEETDWKNPVVAPEDSQTMGGTALPPKPSQPEPCGVFHSDCVPTPKRDKITPVVDTTTEPPTWTEPSSVTATEEEAEEAPYVDDYYDYGYYSYAYSPYYYNPYYYSYYYGYGYNYPQPTYYGY